MQQALGITLRLGERIEPMLDPGRPLPVAALMLGRAAVEAAEMLPRLFNLCRAAQGMAARLALGLPGGDVQALRAEVTREHLFKLLVVWPGMLGLPARALPTGDGMAEAVFGPQGLPDAEGFAGWLAAGAGVAPLMAAVAAAFAPGEAVADLPMLRPEAALSIAAVENSPAGRQAGSDLLAHLAKTHGKGPLWRAMGRLVDLHDPLPAPLVLADGTALVPAARGTYALRARQTGGIVSAFARVTPTDHMTAAGGALEMSLASLPPQKAHLARLVVDILDPCVPVTISQVQHA
ncbi:hypothetical protein [Rhodobacter ferrooxidans]|uniref:HupK n=1 Tax=Rhodobacter ferrooxidans TaxID=371731 RepID=C8S278_9RHOB|nr:hypothetical protein [Rhodobacter sp. SW2]EEW24950.1 HupK [Rhodobacter sp. SW2]